MASTVPLHPWMSQICVALACSCICSGLAKHTTTPLKQPPFNTHAGTVFATRSKSNNQWLPRTNGRFLHSPCITAMKEQAVTASRQSPMRAHSKIPQLLHGATSVQALHVLLPHHPCSTITIQRVWLQSRVPLTPPQY